MAENDYVSAPVADDLGLRGIIIGLATDIESLRAGRISVAEAQARAALAKQLFNGCRIYLQAIKMVEQGAQPISASTTEVARDRKLPRE